MSAKSVRNMIISLIIVAFGVKAIIWVSNRYISQANAYGFSDLIKGFTGLGDIVFYGLIVLAILLLPYYFSKRRDKNALPNRTRPLGRE